MPEDKEKPTEDQPVEDKEKAEEKPAETPAADTSILKEYRAEREEMVKVVESMKKENDRTAELQGNAVLAGKGFVDPDAPELTKEQQKKYVG